MSVLERIKVSAKSLIKDVGNRAMPWESGTELVGIIELPTGTAQFHLTLTRDDMDFLDVDKPTGCADDLVATADEFK